jgi:hypothetical protein
MCFYLKHIPKLALALALNSPVQATELTHHFVNPSFGGNPLNGVFLLNQADQQNNFTDPSRPQPKSNFEKFKDRVNQATLNKLAQSAITDSPLFDNKGNPVVGGPYKIGDLTITVSVDPLDPAKKSITVADGITDPITFDVTPAP